MHKPRRNTVIGFTIVVILTLVITLSPAIDVNLGRKIKDIFRVLHDRGLPTWITYHRVEFLSNIALIIPLGYFLGRFLPRKQLWIGYTALPAASVTIELIQALAIPGRVGSVSDVVANSLGAWIGLTAAVVSSKEVGAKPRGASTGFLTQ